MGLGANILVVEDEAVERHALTALLRAEGYHVFEARDATDAIDLLEDNIDLVLCDLRLPGQRGIELMEAWKRQQPRTPFVFVSGAVDIQSAVDAVKHGADDYIAKPIHPVDLLDRIAHCLQTLRPSIANGANGQRTRAADFPSYEDALQLNLPEDASMDEIERAAIEHALEKHHGNRTRAAQSLGISVRTLQRKLKAWNAAELNGMRAR
ncbi:MAG: response regulator [Pirellulales bacterium]|nr:response regulator [Pirellulales bacterium]